MDKTENVIGGKVDEQVPTEDSTNDNDEKRAKKARKRKRERAAANDAGDTVE